MPTIPMAKTRSHDDDPTTVTISGTSYDEISGGGFWQQEHTEIADKFRSRRQGKGRQYVADLQPDEVDALYHELTSQAGLLESGGTDDDALYRRIAKTLRRDAERMR